MPSNSTSEPLLRRAPEVTLQDFEKVSREKPVNLQLSRIKPALRMVLGRDAVEPVDRTSILSGTPAQIIHFIFEQAFSALYPKRIQLLVEESNSARMFLWHSDREKEGPALVKSEEFDHSSADPYLQLMPGGDWTILRSNRRIQRPWIS